MKVKSTIEQVHPNWIGIAALIIGLLACPAGYLALPQVQAFLSAASSVPTSVPSPTLVTVSNPTATPTPVCLSQSYFPSITRNYPQLGCPTNSAEFHIAYQRFKKGELFWREGTLPIYAVFATNNRWESRIATSFDLCPQVDSILGPILGFGNLWCIYWQEQLGKADEAGTYFGGINVEEYSSGGLVIKLADPLGGRIMFADGTFRIY